MVFKEVIKKFSVLEDREQNIENRLKTAIKFNAFYIELKKQAIKKT